MRVCEKRRPSGLSYAASAAKDSELREPSAIATTSVGRNLRIFPNWRQFLMVATNTSSGLQPAPDTSMRHCARPCIACTSELQASARQRTLQVNHLAGTV